MTSRNFTDGAQRAISRASQLAVERGHVEVTPTHLLWSLLAEESLAFEILEQAGIDHCVLESRNVWGSDADDHAVGDFEDPTIAALTRDVAAALDGLLEDAGDTSENHTTTAELSAKKLGNPVESYELHDVKQRATLLACSRTRHDEVASEHLLAALSDIPSAVSEFLREFGISVEAMGFSRSRDEPLGEAMPVEFQIDVDRDAPSEQTAAIRVIDAAANRVREGLRVVEDFVRFTLGDAHLSRLLKSARHQLTAVMQFLDPEQLIASRDTQADVGTGIRTAGEMSRTSLLDVARANLKRVQEAARTLEEFAKVVAPNPGRPSYDTEREAGLGLPEQLGQLRYRLYTLEKAVLTAVGSRTRLEGCELYLLLTSDLCKAPPCDVLQDALRAGVRVVQIREKHMTARDLIEHARRVRQITRDAGALLIINDRPDLAVLCDADGVHVGQDELTVHDARRIVGPERLIGVSTHSIEQARQAVLDGASYIGVGPVFATGTKSFEDSEFVGVDLVREVAAEISLPWFAIGGIGLSNIVSVIEAGAGRVAVTGAVCSAEDAKAAASTLVRKLRVN
jgi:thiamine-phosphate pyrophosphorylase